VKLSVGLDLPPGVSITSVKWQKNGTDISGATDSTLSLPITAADNGAKIKAIVTTSAGTLTSADANIAVATIANEFAPGVVKFEAYTDISGTAISNLTDSDKYTANTPDDIQLLTAIDTPNSYGDNYGAKVTGFIIPQDSGDYTFFLRSDDASQLWLSTDENPANAVLIAEETGCCQAFLEPDSTVANWHDNGSGMGQTALTPIKLTAGKKYAFYALLKEGGGGDYLQVALRKAGDKTPAASLRPIGGAWIGANAKPNIGDPQITQQPVLPASMIQGQPWSLSVNGSVSPAGFNYPVVVQWQKNGADIPGATSKSFTISSVTPTDAGTYRAVVSAPSGKSVTSTELTAKVDLDTTPPTLVTAQRSFKTDTKVNVIFSEPVSAATAGTAANYKINNGVTVSAATVSTNNPRQVELTTSSIAKGSTNQLTVSGVQDRFGNTIAASSSINIGLQKSIFFVTADPGPLTFPGDIAVQQHLLDRGFDVTLAMGSDVPDDGSTALGSDLIIESSSLGSGTVETADGVGKFRALAIPALEWEASSTDAFGFQQANPTTGTTDNQTQINIVDPSSPLAAGFPAGPVTVTSAGATYSQSTPTGAHIVATLAGSPDQDVLYSYEKGDKGYNGFVMPARRVFFFFQDNTASVANDNGWKVLDAAVDWLLGIQSSTPSQGGGGGGGSGPTLGLTRSANSLTISWSGTGTLQSATSLTAPVSWKDETSTSPFQTTPAGAAKFFRLK